jgi:hypothetical protein
MMRYDRSQNPPVEPEEREAMQPIESEPRTKDISRKVRTIGAVFVIWISAATIYLAWQTATLAFRQLGAFAGMCRVTISRFFHVTTQQP